jgi:hypothetical protein
MGSHSLHIDASGRAPQVFGRPRILRLHNRATEVGSLLADRRRNLLRRRWRQRRLSTRLLRVRIRSGRLRRNVRGPLAGRGWLGRRGRLRFRARRRLRRLRRLRDLQGIARVEHGQRKRRNSQPCRDQRGCEQHFPSVFALAVFGRHRSTPRNCSRGKRPAGRMVPPGTRARSEPPRIPASRRRRPRCQRPAARPWRSRPAPRPARCRCGAPEFPRRPRAARSGWCRRYSPRP